MLTGRWPFSSNCQHSAWIVFGALVQNADGSIEPEPRLVFVPARDVTIHDTWHVAGMRGTGSHDTAVDGLVVDLDHSCRFSDVAWPDGPLWRMPIFNVSCRALPSSRWALLGARSGCPGLSATSRPLASTSSSDGVRSRRVVAGVDEAILPFIA